MTNELKRIILADAAQELLDKAREAVRGCSMSCLSEMTGQMKALKAFVKKLDKDLENHYWDE